MREIRPSGSEGGVGLIPHPYPYRQRGSALNQMVCANFPAHPISPSFFAIRLRLCDSAFIPRSCP